MEILTIVGALFGGFSVGTLITFIIVNSFYEKRLRKLEERDDERHQIVSAIGKLCATVENSQTSYKLGALSNEDFREVAVSRLEEINAKLLSNIDKLDPYFIKTIERFIRDIQGILEDTPTQKKTIELPVITPDIKLEKEEGAPRIDTVRIPAQKKAVETIPELQSLSDDGPLAIQTETIQDNAEFKITNPEPIEPANLAIKVKPVEEAKENKAPKKKGRKPKSKKEKPIPVTLEEVDNASSLENIFESEATAEISLSDISKAKKRARKRAVR